MVSGTNIAWHTIIFYVLICPIAVVVIGFVINQFIKRGFSKFYLGWEKYEKEKEKTAQAEKEKVAEKEKHLDEWRANLTSMFNEFKTSFDAVKAKMPLVITIDQCAESHDEMYQKINAHSDRIMKLETNADNRAQRIATLESKVDEMRKK